MTHRTIGRVPASRAGHVIAWGWRTICGSVVWTEDAASPDEAPTCRACLDALEVARIPVAPVQLALALGAP